GKLRTVVGRGLGPPVRGPGDGHPAGARGGRGGLRSETILVVLASLATTAHIRGDDNTAGPHLSGASRLPKPGTTRHGCASGDFAERIPLDEAGAAMMAMDNPAAARAGITVAVPDTGVDHQATAR
ncbi:MAG TPA: hypothetical protein VJ301_10180, partial [Propionibacteriaceae bacterium]|nr:hypothetical protein [Propionibacteriaceae bacterium]